jgi:Arc/MetJ family transcription regulator
MRTNIVIDDQLVKKGMKYTGITTKKKLVDYALRELIKRKERKGLLTLKGKFQWEGDLNQMRKSRFNDLG